MKSFKRFVKRNSHNSFFKALAGFGRSLNRYYENRNHDIYSNGELTILKKFATLKASIIIDGGANIGKYSLMVVKYHPNAKIYAFEPVIKTYEILKNNTAAYPNIVPVDKGFFKENTSKEINVYSSDTFASLYNIEGLTYKPVNSIVINLIKGDQFIEENKIAQVDFLKLDLEGAEYDALHGFENSLKNKTIRAIQFEFGYINITTKNLLIDYIKFFEQYGYIVGKIFPKIVEFRKYEHKYEDFMGPNFIAVHKSDTELINILTRK